MRGTWGGTPSGLLGRRLASVAGALMAAGLLAALPTQPNRSAVGKDDPSGPAAREKSITSLKQFALAFHNHNADQGRLPPARVYDKDGRPLYSWRVLILPYLGEKKLYEEFRLDEPWDGPHNKKLLAKMPEVFG